LPKVTDVNRPSDEYTRNLVTLLWTLSLVFTQQQQDEEEEKEGLVEFLGNLLILCLEFLSYFFCE
jgi:hypothetical protein